MIHYKQRWQIETLFRGLKSIGFNIEDTHAADPERLEKLFPLAIIALVWCYRIGDYIDENVRRIEIKKHGRGAVSVFKCGLDYLSKALLTGFNSLEYSVFKFLSCTSKKITYLKKMFIFECTKTKTTFTKLPLGGHRGKA